MQTEKFVSAHPWAILAAGAGIQLLTGLPAAWGVLQQPVMEGYALEEGTASLAFSVLIAAYGAGSVLGGFLQDRQGPRKAALWGTALLEAGLAAAALLPAGLGWALPLAFSIPAGLGTAFLYPAVQSCAQKWYRNRKGMATGVIGAAAGLSGAFLAFLIRALVPRWGVRGAFWALGGAALPVCLGGAALLADPPRSGQTASAPQSSGLAPGEMLRTRQYWLCTAAVCLSTPAVLLFSPILLKLGCERGLSEGQAVWGVVLGSVGSTAGRLLMPLLSDKIGRRRTDLILFALSAGLSAGFAFARGWAVVGVYAGLTFCYSGLSAVLPAFSTDLFGLAHAGVNYGFLALGQSAGSLLFPLTARALGLETGRHWLALAAAAAGWACIWFLKPDGKNADSM